MRQLKSTTRRESEPGRKRLAFFLPNLYGGGAQQVTVTLANELAKRGYQVDLLVAYNEGELWSAVDENVARIDLNTPRIPIVGSGAAMPRIQRYLSSNRPTALISAMAYANVSALIASALTRMPNRVVVTEHTTAGMQTGRKDRIVNRVATRLYPLADAVVAVSEGVARDLADSSPVKREAIKCIPNPIVSEKLIRRSFEDLDNRWLSADEKTVVLSAGRLEPEKDYETLIRAFERISDEHDNARLVVLGNGSEKRQLESLTRELGVNDRVAFPGYVSNPYSWMRNADAFALSSRFEGLPTVLVEAMACGCPVVSTDCPHGPREILRGGEYGPLVPVGDDVALAEALCSVLERPQYDDVLRDRASDFSVEAAVDEYANLIETLDA
ncbi:glycosyltransferase (plasmid) [Halorussus limi]|uniref:Glycosyltransferase n=1 Tax=Halorussus limi TaxID=2938695 RepID=A0A8U0I153_9EURY|nr:glycosyltransferase [Halorussus limi]UPV76636.1 glycosyltransferase [Halorussus limi]